MFEPDAERDLEEDPFARLRASMTAGELTRIAVMERVRAYHRPFPARDDRISTLFRLALEDLITRHDPERDAGDDNRTETGGLVVLGETGAGKSRAIRSMIDGHGAFPGYLDPRSDCQAVTVEVRAPITYLGLGRAVLQATGLPVVAKMERHLVWEAVYKRLLTRKILVLHFNELHNFYLSCNRTDRVDSLNMIKTLMTNPIWPVVVLISGLSMLRKILQGHGEDRRRHAFVSFKPLKVPQHNAILAEIATKMAAIAEIPLTPDFETEIAPRLAHAGLYQWGTCAKLLHFAIRETLARKRPALDINRLADAYASRTGSSREANPFLCRNYSRLDCSLVLRDDASPEEPDQEIPAAKRRMRR